MTTIGRVGGLWRFPVKSLQGEQVEQLAYDATGAAGDRIWGIVDDATGKVLTAKRYGVLLEASARLDDASGTVTITLPDGTEHEAGAPGTDAALSAWLGRPVHLGGPDPAASTAYELVMDPTDDDSEPWDFATPPGSLVDLAPIHLLTDASLAAGVALHPDGVWSVDRFRPGVLVEVAEGARGFVEDAWIGVPVTVGPVVVETFMPTPRCGIPARAQPTQGLARDAAICHSLRDHHENNLGVYATITTPGVVRVGDPVTT